MAHISAFPREVYFTFRDAPIPIQWNVQKYLCFCVYILATINAERKLKNQMLIHDVKHLGKRKISSDNLGDGWMCGRYGIRSYIEILKIVERFCPIKCHELRHSFLRPLKQTSEFDTFSLVMANDGNSFSFELIMANNKIHFVRMYIIFKYTHLYA